MRERVGRVAGVLLQGEGEATACAVQLDHYWQ